VEVKLHFLKSAPDGDRWSVSRLGRFTPREISLRTLWIRGWVGPKVGLDVMEKRKIFPLPEIELQLSSPLL
jgi:hypothetical protein